MLIERLERVALAGGSAWVLYLLVFLSIVSIGVMLERWIYFSRRRTDIDRLADELVDRLRHGDERSARELLLADPSIEASVVEPVLEWLEGGPEAVEEALECEMGKQRRELERSMTYLGTLGNNAPFIGLLGTVLGVIQAFHQLGEGQTKQAMGNVMTGIAEALIATGVGLVVALPAVVAYNVFQKKAAEIEANVAIISKKLLAYLKMHAKLSAEFAALGERYPQAAAALSSVGEVPGHSPVPSDKPIPASGTSASAKKGAMRTAPELS